MRRRFSPLWLLALIPVALLAVYEPYEYVTAGSPPLSVRQNPFAAAERLLEQWGHDSRHVLSSGALYPLPSRDTLLVLTRERGGISGGRVDALLDWVRSGGHLVVTAAKPARTGERDKAANWQQRDPLLFALGLTSRETMAPQPGAEPLDFVDSYLNAEHMFETLCINSTNEMRERCIGFFCRREEPLVDSRLPTPEGTRRLALPSGLALRHASLGHPEAPAPEEPVPSELVRRADNDWGAQLAAFRVDNGEVTVLSGLDLWHNNSLHLLDHAWLLADLVRDAGPVWFIQNMDMPPLGRWLWQQAWPLIIGLTLVLALFLWRRMPRIGPILASPAAREPDFLDHLSASGRFLWRTDQPEALLQPLRDDIRRRLAHHAVPRGERYRYLARFADLDEARVQRAMSDNPETRDAVVETVSTLQQIRSRL